MLGIFFYGPIWVMLEIPFGGRMSDYTQLAVKKLPKGGGGKLILHKSNPLWVPIMKKKTLDIPHFDVFDSDHYTAASMY